MYLSVVTAQGRAATWTACESWPLWLEHMTAGRLTNSACTQAQIRSFELAQPNIDLLHLWAAGVYERVWSYRTRAKAPGSPRHWSTTGYLREALMSIQYWESSRSQRPQAKTITLQCTFANKTVWAKGCTVVHYRSFQSFHTEILLLFACLFCFLFFWGVFARVEGRYGGRGKMSGIRVHDMKFTHTHKKVKFF